ncbi:hypothetical protein P3T76_001092 [Phytophthora citrophthora]|uniref:SWIM-type domain-containing protein n=1 Tax=Phytophthora citrophthora TaxID=4793 RepID=A0AAD9GYE9_9STRA|nr:hypothetical protein P3T76_001092 [Phytophthora citrophthora]
MVADAGASSPEPTLYKGKRFQDSKSAFYAVQDYALYYNKQVKVARRGGKHRRMVCASTESCPFFVQLYLHNSKTDHTWYVSSADLTHSPECTSTAKPTQRQLVESPIFQQALAASPNGTATQLLQQLKGRTNLRTIYRAKQIMKQELLSQIGNSFRKIPSLLQSFTELNPGSLTKYEVGDLQSRTPGAFSRAFLSCYAFTQSTSFNQQIYGFEVVPCNNNEANYQGVQLFLLGKDGNMRNVTIAVACCDAPSSENYRWFFRCVEESGVNLRYCPVLCAIDSELLAVEHELGLTLRYCTRYIIEHELAQIRTFNRHHHTLLWGLQGATTEMEYNNRLEWIGTTCGPAVENYIRQFPMERWVVAGNIDKVAMYGWRSRTFYETPEQEQQDVAGAGQGFSNGLDIGGNASNGASAADLYDVQCKLIGEYKVSRASETVAFVTKMNGDPSHRRRVDLQASTCTCDFIVQYAIPCRHFIAVLLFCEQMDSVIGRFAPGYLVENYILAFRGKTVELPLESAVREDLGCAPPMTVPTSAVTTGTNDEDLPRPGLKRPAPGTAIDTGNEAVAEAGQGLPPRIRLCKKCRTPGHNSRSCAGENPIIGHQSI